MECQTHVQIVHSKTHVEGQTHAQIVRCKTHVQIVRSKTHVECQTHAQSVYKTHVQVRPCQRHVQIVLRFCFDKTIGPFIREKIRRVLAKTRLIFSRINGPNIILLEVRLCSLAESEPPSHEHFKDCSVLCNEPSSTSADVCEATDKSPGLPETVSSKRLKEKQKGLSACKKGLRLSIGISRVHQAPTSNQRAGFSSRVQTHLELRDLIKLKRPFCNCNFNRKRLASPEVF